MTTYFLDASALAKRYLTETGSQWILTITSPTAGHTIIVAEITRVEVASALAARHRASLGFTQQQRDRAVKLLLHHCLAQYRTASLNPVTISRAVNLTQNYRIRLIPRHLGKLWQHLLGIVLTPPQRPAPRFANRPTAPAIPHPNNG